MPKNQLNKDELICHVLKLKAEVDGEPKTVWQGEKDMAHKYLNRVLNRIEEYRYQGLTGWENRSIINKSVS